MRLHIDIRVPMGCPHPGCDGEDFDILMSHPFGSASTEMSAKCEKCGKQFFTGKGLFAQRLRADLDALIEKMEARP